MRTRRHAAAVVVVAALGSIALADDDALVKGARASGRVLTDGKGHYIVFPTSDPSDMANHPYDEKHSVWYGDGKTFHHVGASYANLDPVVQWTVSDPRVGIDLKESLVEVAPKPRMMCESRVTELSVVPDADARTLLAKAAFKGDLVERRAYVLGREGTTYYYVDGVEELANGGSKKARLFIGKRGGMKELKITRFDTDEAGTTITTAKGVLRSTRHWAVLAQDRVEGQKLVWMPKGGKPIELADLEAVVNGRLIYSDLGIYPARLGTPCDDL